MLESRRLRARHALAVRHPDRRTRPVHGGKAARARRWRANNALAVVGAGHLKGMAKYLADETRAPAALTAELSRMREAQHPVDHHRADAALICGGIAWGFAAAARTRQGPAAAMGAVDRRLAGLGALLARGHLLSIPSPPAAAPLAVPPRPAAGHVQRAGGSAPAQAGLSGFPRIATTRRRLAAGTGNACAGWCWCPAHQPGSMAGVDLRAAIVRKLLG